MTTKICPICGSKAKRIEDGFKCQKCGYSETPIGWNDYRSIRKYEKRLKERGILKEMKEE